MTDDQPSNAPRPSELPLEEWQIWVENAAGRLSGRVRHCAQHAFVHLKKAWRLQGIDNEMAAFRSITAEEEAATAIIHALQRQQYPGASRLKARNHIHKCAFWPLVSAVGKVFHELGIPAPKISINKTGDPRVAMALDVTALAGQEGEAVWAEPDYPLNFSMKSGEVSTEAVYMFDKELAELANSEGKSSITKHFELEANLRNLLLYADDSGIPAVSLSDDLILSRTQRVAVLVTLSIIILQTPKHQSFVLQCLEALLRALEVNSELAFDYTNSSYSENRPILEIHRNRAEGAHISMRWKVPFVARASWNLPLCPYHWIASAPQKFDR